MYDNLIRRDPRDGQTIIPDLAHRWEISPDGRAYTFFLRQGVKFHDGAEFTAEDVQATYARIIWPPKGISIPRAPLFAAVSEINILDPYTIEFKLREPRPSSFMLGAFAMSSTILALARSGMCRAKIKRFGFWNGTPTTGIPASPTWTAWKSTICPPSLRRWLPRYSRARSIMGEPSIR
jgi:hypothetical protein